MDLVPDNYSTGGPVDHANVSRSTLPFVAASDGGVFKDIMSALNIYVTPLLVAVGMVGNTLSCLVFVCTRLRHQSSSIYLACLAIVDTVFLFAILITWLSWLKIELVHREGWCQLVVYITYVCGFMSVWCVVCFTVERYIVVSFPLKKHKITARRAKVVVCSLCTFALAVYSFALWTTVVFRQGSRSMCMPKRRYFKLVFILSNVDSLVTLLLPMVVIVCLNVRIVIRVYQFQRRYDLMSNSSARSSSQGGATGVCHRDKTTPTRLNEGLHRGSLSVQSTACPRDSRHLNSRVTLRMRTQMKITRLLLVVSTIFIILNVPSHAIRAHAFAVFLLQKSPHSTALELRFQELLQFMYYLSFSVNFFLYSLCGRNFRKGLRYLFRRMRDKLCGTCRDHLRHPRAHSLAQHQIDRCSPLVNAVQLKGVP